ncbi:dipeptide ABC transporter ATP-binding protein [Herbiconiux ginsengi]|uniref:Peptide/nickel transport system ATP-binding protein n=1 Tax=Herbiconiux ginsengi TaxID=381665 RepID=A0A1H3QEX3_9MICO|nr:ABC transporter ATP-binding protein [Herbiconiux ginsengi]SDZ12052.1 peptide/nickel transport system ATP-binding protein [Herbiconiux ginsengi]
MSGVGDGGGASAESAGGEPLLRVRELRVGFGRGDSAPVVDGVSFELHAGRALAIVGESGSGKSVTARSLVGLAGAGSWQSAEALDVLGASVLGGSRKRAGRTAGGSGDEQLDGDGRPGAVDPGRVGADRGLSAAAWRRIRGRQIGLIVQDALVSLDPLRPIGREIADGLRLHTRLSVAQRRERVLELLDSVGMPDPASRIGQRSGELSGGLRQRALIAAGLSADPPVLIADEPTTALDATVQAQILALLETVKARGTALLFISHDLAVVSRIADDVLVMRGGRVVESGPTEAVLRDPQHEYTRQLLRAVPTGVPRGVRLSAPATPAAAPLLAPAPTAALALPTTVAPNPAPPTATAPTPTPSTATAPTPTPSAATAPPAIGATATPAPPSATTPAPSPPATGATATPAPVALATARDGGSALRAGRSVLEVRAVSKAFPIRGAGRGAERVAVDDVSIALERGTTLGLVGESGSGKTTLARIVLGLTAPDTGTVTLEGDAWVPLPERQRRPRRGRLGAVYQDALSSFDPRLTVRQILTDARSGRRDSVSRGDTHAAGRHGLLGESGRSDAQADTVNRHGDASEAGILRDGRNGWAGSRTPVSDLLDDVGLATSVLDRRPLELSGGQRQRVSIARALAADPAVLICDEPVSALDVSIQAQILDLFDELQQRRGISYLFISHDLGVVQHMSDRVAVMKDGQIVEQGETAAVFASPAHPYTRALFDAAPRVTTP